MIEYTIHFKLHPEKASEFAHSWKCFCEHTQETEGLSDCRMSEIEDNYHEISMTWSERFYLNLFMKGEWHDFLHGAVNVLGNESVITQRDVKP